MQDILFVILNSPRDLFHSYPKKRRLWILNFTNKPVSHTIQKQEPQKQSLSHHFNGAQQYGILSDELFDFIFLQKNCIF